MKKRIITFILIIALVAACPFAHAEALRGKCGENLTWELSDGTLTISGTGDMYDDGEFDVSPWRSHGLIRRAVIKKGVTGIARGAFRDCGFLESVTLPDGLKSIGDYAFYGSSVGAFTIPDSVEFVGWEALRVNCYDDICEHEGGFQYVGDCLTGVDDYKTAVAVRDGTRLIVSGIFHLMIGSGTVYIPASVRYVCPPARYSLLDIDPENPYFVRDPQGALYNADMTALLSAKQVAGDYTVPDGVTAVADYAFYKNGLAETVTLPDSVKAIGKYAFYDCASLKRAPLPPALEKLGSEAFADCVSLESVSVPGTLETVPQSAFAGCTSLSEVSLGEGTKVIDACAFSGCTALTDIKIPQSVKVVGAAAFESCDGLKNVRFASPYTVINEQHGFITIPRPVTLYGGGHSFAHEMAARHSGIGFTQTDDYDCPFTDVDPAYYYSAPVRWAADSGVTSGVSADKFAPDKSCTRAQIVTFLWRAAGRPEPSVTEHPFTDVNGRAYYYKAMLWAVENGITNGVTATEFAPDADCTRAQIVTFLWRAKGNPAARYYRRFSDVKENAYYYEAVAWAVTHNVTNGYMYNQFAPKLECTRSQAATFIFRDANLSDVIVHGAPEFCSFI